MTIEKGFEFGQEGQQELDKIRKRAEKKGGCSE